MLVICNFLWAGNFVFGKVVIADLSPLWITFLRWLLALLFLFPLAGYLEQPNWRKALRQWPLLVAMGLFGVIFYNLILYSALSYTTPTNASLVASLNPAVLVAASIVLYRERFSLWQFLGFVLSLCGVVSVLLNGQWERLLSLTFNQGDLLMFGAVLVWTVYSFLAKYLQSGPITATALSTTFAVVLMAPLALSDFPQWQQLQPVTFLGIGYMVLFPSVCSFVFWNQAVLAIGASRAGIFLNLIPVFTALIGFFLGESLSVWQGLGGLLVFSGVYLTTGRFPRTRKTQSKLKVCRSSDL